MEPVENLKIKTSDVLKIHMRFKKEEEVARTQQIKILAEQIKLALQTSKGFPIKMADSYPSLSHEDRRMAIELAVDEPLSFTINQIYCNGLEIHYANIL
jgi:hypothetical protein